MVTDHAVVFEEQTTAGKYQEQLFGHHFQSPAFSAGQPDDKLYQLVNEPSRTADRIGIWARWLVVNISIGLLRHARMHYNDKA